MRHWILYASLLAAGASAGVVLATGASLRAAGTEADSTPRVIPYDGYIEFDGAPISSTIPMTFRLTDGANVFTDARDEVVVHGGRFSVMLGAGATPVPAWIWNASDVTLSIEVDGVLLSNSQRIVPVPYAYWAAEGADFRVDGDLSNTRDGFIGRDLGVARNATVTGNLQATDITAASSLTSSGTLNVTGVASIGGNASVTGSASVGDLNTRSIEARWGGGTPFLDFSNDNASDFDARLRLTGDDVLRLEGASLTIDQNLYVNGTIGGSGRLCLVHDTCRDSATFACGGSAACGLNEFVVGGTDGTSCSVANKFRCCTVRLAPC